MSIAHIISGTSITVVVDFTPRAISSSHPNYDKIKTLAGDPNATEADIKPLLDIPETIKTFTDGAVYVKNGRLYHNGAEVRTSLGAKIMEFVRAGDNALADTLKIFLQNVAMNPDPRAQQDLYDWLQAAKLPITGDGYILAWKAVRSDYRSIHAPTDERFDHRVGNRVEQPRDECDADPNRTCSQGLHFCAASYLTHYASGGNRVVVVKIHPRDVVSFPRDYGLAKGRACGYDVVGEVPFDQVPNYYPQGRPVDTRFDKPAPVAPTKRFFNGKLEVGHVYRLRDGRNAVCTKISDDLCYVQTTDGSVYAELSDGRQYNANIGKHHDLDVVKEIEFDLTAEDFAVGQKWVNRSGKVVTIAHVGQPYLRLDNGDILWTENGRVYRKPESTKMSADLVFRLGWTKPAPAPTLVLEVGKTYRTRGGGTVKLTGTFGGVIHNGKSGFTSNERSYTGHNWSELPAGRCSTLNETPDDIVDFTPIESGVGAFDLRVGDTVKTANGRELTVRSIELTHTYPIRTSDGASYTVDGCYFTHRSSVLDIIAKA